MFSIQPKLNPNEEVRLRVKLHWWFFIRQIIVLLIASGLGVTAIALEFTFIVLAVALVLVVAALIWLAFRYLLWVTTNLLVTTDRLITRNGVLNRSGIEIPLERVNTVFFAQSFFERLLGSGDLVVESAGEQGSQRFTNVAHPLAVQNEIYQQIEANENRKFDRAAIASSQSIPEQIEKLDELRRRGVLTEKEFQETKTELLDRL